MSVATKGPMNGEEEAIRAWLEALGVHVVVLGKFSPGLIGTPSEPDQTPGSWSQSGIFPKMQDCLVSSLGNPISPEMVPDPVWTGTAQLI